MLNIFWPFCIVISIIIAVVTGRIENINNAVFESTASAVELTITLIGTMCLWSGIMEIAVNTSIIGGIKKLLRPIMKLLFPKINLGDEEYNFQFIRIRKCSYSFRIKSYEFYAKKE